MYKKTFLLLLIGCVFIAACSETTESTQKEIITFSFLATNNGAITNDVLATIEGNTIMAILPGGTDKNALVATFQTSGKSVSVGGTVQTTSSTTNSFTNELIYMITAEDGSTAQYTVQVFSWENMGISSGASVTDISLVIDMSEKPIVGSAISGQISLARWNSGTNWDNLGAINLAAGTESTIDINKTQNKPVAVCRNFGQPVSKIWTTGTSWNSMGDPSSGVANINYLRIRYVQTGETYFFIYEDMDNEEKSHVTQWLSGTDWTNRGLLSSGEASYNDMCIGLDNKPIVVFCDHGNGTNAVVKRWESGTNWTSLGIPSTAGAACTKIELDPTDGKPIVAFQDWENSRGLRIMKWDQGTNWIDMGFTTTSEVTNISLVISTNGEPFVSYKENNSQIHVAKFISGNAWIDYSFPESGDSPCMAVGPDGMPTIAFIDNSSGDVTTVYKLQ